MSAQLEIACFNLASALVAATAGANRIELCRDYASGGLTPDPFDLARIRGRIKVPIYVMLRDTADFSISFAGLQLLKHQMLALKTAGADGFVFGFLDAHASLEESSNRMLIELADGLPCTLHRAFDACSNKDKALDDAVHWGFSAILSSGGAANALSGIQQLNLWQAQTPEISFIAGGGIRQAHFPELLQKSELQWYHSAALTIDKTLTDSEEVQQLKSLLP